MKIKYVWLLVLLLLLGVACTPSQTEPVSSGDQTSEETQKPVTSVDGQNGQPVVPSMEVHTAEDVAAYFEAWPEGYKERINDEVVVLYTWPDALAHWMGGALVYHVPTVSTAVLDFEGNLNPQLTHYENAEAEAAIKTALGDAATLARLQEKVQSLWSSLSSAAPSVMSTDDEVAIYAAVIRQIYTVDDTFGGELESPVIYIVQMTDDSHMSGDDSFTPAPAAPISAEVQAALTAELADLSDKIEWVATINDAPTEPAEKGGMIKDHGQVITLGNIHLQEDGSALVPASTYVAPMAAGGQTYIVENVDGVWQVTGNTGVQWMS